LRFPRGGSSTCSKGDLDARLDPKDGTIDNGGTIDVVGTIDVGVRR
jgi:hypothetical protein